MIESLAEHGVEATDLVPSLMTTHTVANPEYDPAEAKRQEVEKQEAERLRDENVTQFTSDKSDEELEGQTLNTAPAMAESQAPLTTPTTAQQRTTVNVLQPTATTSMPGVSTTLSSTDANVTLDIRWTILCDLFLLLIADSVYDSRSRVLLESVAVKLGLGWLDVVKFEKRVTDALEIQEGVEKMEQKDVIEGRMKAAKKKRYVMMGLATLGAWISMCASCRPHGGLGHVRWWSCHWPFGWFASPGHWGWAGRSVYHHWSHWHVWLLCRRWGRSSYYYQRSHHWFGDCC